MSHKKRARTNSPAPDKHKHPGSGAAPAKADGAPDAPEAAAATEHAPRAEPNTELESAAFAVNQETTPGTAATSEARSEGSAKNSSVPEPTSAGGPPDGAPAAEAEPPAPETAAKTPKDALPENTFAAPPPSKNAPEDEPAAPDKPAAKEIELTESEQSKDAPAQDEHPENKAAGNKPDKPASGKPDAHSPAADTKGFSPRRFAENFGAPDKPRSLRRKLLFALLGFGLLLLAGVGYAAFEANTFLNTPAREFDFEKTVEVEILRGDTFGKVAARLEKAGIITNALYFRLYAMWEGRTGSIQAGVFEFSTVWDPREVLHHLVFGHPVLYRLTIREGLPWWEVAKIVEENGFATAEDFKEVIHDPEFLAKHNIPFASAEGFLFPDTYFLRKPKEMNKDAALALADRLVGTFAKKTKDLFAEAGVDKDEAKLKEVIILASMVEKETGIADERGLVAGVFANRLRLGMLMQCDPTIIYGLGESFNGNIRRRDLEDDKNPYNTYRHPGLPPGPICSPGLAAIAAAAHPAEHDYLYFVATQAGGEHIFNSSLNEHNKAVNKYQRNRGG